MTIPPLPCGDKYCVAATIIIVVYEHSPLMLVNIYFLMLSYFVQWTFHPFIFKSKKIYTVLLWCRVLAFLVVSDGFTPFATTFDVFGSMFLHWFSCTILNRNHDLSFFRPDCSFLYFPLQASQFLRIITFYSTQLPGPNYHCREVHCLCCKSSDVSHISCYT